MTEEDFLAWRENPVTQWFMHGLLEVAVMNEELVMGRALGASQAGKSHEIDPREQDALGIKAMAYRQIATAKFEHILNFHEDSNEHQRD